MATKRQRPSRAAAPRPRRVTLRLEAALIERAARLAHGAGVTVPQLLRVLVGEAIERREIERGLAVVEVPEMLRQLVARRGGELTIAMQGRR